MKQRFVDVEAPYGQSVSERSSSRSSDVSADVDDEGHQDKVELEPVPMDEDTFGMTLCAMTRDAHFIARGDGTCPVRILRLLVTLMLLFLTFGLQALLIRETRHFVTSRAVKEIRDAYDLFETTIYGEGNTSVNRNGRNRGIPSTYPGDEVAYERLSKLPMEDQFDICRIPLSQPIFFFVILVLWTTTILNDLRRNGFLFRAVIVGTKNIDSMADSLEAADPSNDSKDRLITGYTPWMKILLVFMVFIPRWLIALLLWWVGCRWLLATNSFKDLILNAIALEFVLLLKDGLYLALMPHRNKVDLSNTKVKPWPSKQKMGNLDFSTIASLCSTFFYFALVVGSVVLYIRVFQRVLPDYQWDVHDVCIAFVDKHFHANI